MRATHRAGGLDLNHCGAYQYAQSLCIACTAVIFGPPEGVTMKSISTGLLMVRKAQ